MRWQIRSAGGRHDGDDLLGIRQRLEPPGERLEARGRVGREQPGALHLAAEPAQRFLVEDRDQAARHRLVDDETHRVRTDVDDRNAWIAFTRPLHRRDPW